MAERKSIPGFVYERFFHVKQDIEIFVSLHILLYIAIIVGKLFLFLIVLCQACHRLNVVLRHNRLFRFT